MSILERERCEHSSHELRFIQYAGILQLRIDALWETWGKPTEPTPAAVKRETENLVSALFPYLEQESGQQTKQTRRVPYHNSLLDSVAVIGKMVTIALGMPQRLHGLRRENSLFKQKETE